MTAIPPAGTVVATGALRAGLAEVLGRPVPVSSRKPDPAGLTEFVVVSRVGGGRQTFATQAPRFLIECYHHAEGDAERLALAADVALRHMTGRTVAGGILTGWDGDDNIVAFLDPNPSHFRFQFTGALGIGIAP